MRRERGHDEDTWPVWLEPLRPDPASRTRMRRRILAAAAPLLAGRHPLAWWEVAADWSSVAVPIAASIALLFGWIAYTSSTPAAASTPEPERIEIEALVQPQAPASPPALLIDRTEPSSDALLAATLRQGGR